MKRLLCALFLLPVLVSPAGAYKILYAEQFYRLYHQNFYRYPEDHLENIWYLERALESDFANPLNALTREIETKLDHERYRFLFAMHVNLELTKQYRTLGAGYDKRKAYYFNAPWREMTLRSLRYAESYYEAALYYWEQALEWSHKAWRLRRVDLTDLASWQDDNYRIETGELDYREIISTDLARLRSVRAEFESMDESTY